MGKEQTKVSLAHGASVIRQHVKQIKHDGPGVYRMLGAHDEVLYVGKAKALKKRALSYTNTSKLSNRLQRMVSLTKRMEFVHTQTETEALLLESNLIKKLKPRFNILLRDDKSFPYIFLSSAHDYPMIRKHRGAKKAKGEYFGPFASAGAVNRTINILQRVFMLRNCTDHVFANRTRPCLQYHIKRCTAPCVDYVSQEQYADQVQDARDFLSGKSRQIQDKMAKAMQAASEAMNYEEAARYRDRIRALSVIQSHQDVNFEGVQDADVMALAQQEGKSCIQVFFFRGGRNYGNRPYFPRHGDDNQPAEIMAAFLAQFYDGKPVPKELVLNLEPSEKGLLEQALSEKRGGKVVIHLPQRGRYRRMLDFVSKNAQAALDRHLVETKGEAKLLEGVEALFDLDETPSRIEVYDNSHISGTNMVGAMIVAGPEGLQKNAYRKFNIKQADEADDYAMMREVLARRFKRALKEEEEKGEAQDWPDLVLIDGGLGQLNAVKEVLEEMGVWDALNVVAIAKGVDRHAGRERFFIDGKKPFQLPENDAVLHYLQRLRDEAHRFAIGAHRKRREKQIEGSPLDNIPGVGPKRKKALLHHFGSAKILARASLKDLEKVEGVSKSMAQKIYDYFQE